jgi:penicillin-binding protein 2
MTFLFDPAKAWETLLALEKGWGGTPSERMAAKYKAYAAQYGTSAPKVKGDDAFKAALDSADTQNTTVATEADSPGAAGEPQLPSPTVSLIPSETTSSGPQ